MQLSLSSSQCALLFPKNTLSFLELPFYFPELLFCFLELPFCFIELPFCFPEVSFYFIRMPYCFPELRFSFPEVSFFVYCARLYPRMLFLANYSLSSSCSELLRQIIFALLLFCFLLKLFIDQFMVPCILLLFIFKQ